MAASKEDVKLLMDTFHVDEEKATKMIECGWNVDYMKKGIYETIDAEVNIDGAVSGIKDAINESFKKASEFEKDFK